IVWTANGRAGVKLNSNIDIVGWLPHMSHAQARVDAAVRRIRSQNDAAGQASLSPPTPTRNFDLSELAAEIDAITTSLAADPTILSTRGKHLQRLDIVAQRLRLLSEPPSKRI